MANLPAITDESFDAEVLKSSTPVLVDFWAPWCGPCKQLTPIVEELAKELGAKVKVVAHNIDDAPEKPTEFGVRGIPTLMLFKNGEVVDVKVGAQPKSTLEAWLNSQLA